MQKRSEPRCPRQHSPAVMAARTVGGKGDAPSSLSALRAAENACRRCALYRNATQAVPGQGPRGAPLMLVGEQPGDKEDIAGLPFVGPAGRLLDRALADAGITRSVAFVTNAVKHFKHETRGKRRLHRRPNAYEIDRCRWWLDRERAIVKPDVIVALGATGARGVFGRAVAVGATRGWPLPLDGGVGFVTIHPSLLLRIKDGVDRAREYRAFVDDLALAAKSLRRRAVNRARQSRKSPASPAPRPPPQPRGRSPRP